MCTPKHCWHQVTIAVDAGLRYWNRGSRSHGRRVGCRHDRPSSYLCRMLNIDQCESQSQLCIASGRNDGNIDFRCIVHLLVPFKQSRIYDALVIVQSIGNASRLGSPRLMRAVRAFTVVIHCLCGLLFSENACTEIYLR